MTFKITGMSLRQFQPNKGGSRLMAYFDCHNEEIGFKGCALVKLSGGDWRVWLPKVGEKTVAERRADRVDVYFRAGSTLEAEMLAAARAMYALMDDEPIEDDGPIEYRTFPFTLVSIDGKPVEKSEPDDDASGLHRVLGIDPAVAETMNHAGL